MNSDAWNEMSSEYDNSVEKNLDHVITGYLSEEIKIIVNICKKIIKPDSKYTIIDMGSGTGRVLFGLHQILGDSISYFGLEASKPMIELSKKKQSNLKYHNISFLNHDITDPDIDKLFDDDSVKIVLCVYNTIGVIDGTKRRQFFDNIIKLAGKDGLVLISAFNGDDFVFTAPKIYIPMKKMVKQIDDDSFDEEKLAFKNNLGYYSQWFTKNQVLELLCSNTSPIPININLNEDIRTFGHVFSNHNIV